jgi:hypothetical protein
MIAGPSPQHDRELAGVEGLEPPASGFGDRRSSQLSYTPTVGQRLNQDDQSMGSDAAKAVERMRAPHCQAFMPRTIRGPPQRLKNLHCVLIMFLTPAHHRGIKASEQTTNTGISWKPIATPI